MIANLKENKRILIISAMFFPQPAVGAVRITQWCRYLPDFGWEPTVFCRYYGHRATPEMLREKVHPSVKVEYINPPRDDAEMVATHKPRPLPWWKSAIARSPLSQWPVPDFAQTFWRGARDKVMAMVERLRPDAILTTSPPHGIHDLGLWLSQQVDIPWIADFRDPYLIDPRYRPRGLGQLRRSAHKDYERQIYERAALIVHAIPVQARWARRAYPSARARIVTLTNGCPTELADGSIKPLAGANGRRVICVVGAIARREASGLVKAVAELAQDGSDLELRLVGNPPERAERLKAELGERLVVVGPVRHDQALRHIVSADVLICTLDAVRSRGLGLSSKLFEYLSVGKPVVVINPTASDQRFLRNFQGVSVLDSPGANELRVALQWALDPRSAPPLEQAHKFKKEFDRRTQTAQLAAWLNELTRRSESPTSELSYTES